MLCLSGGGAVERQACSTGVRFLSSSSNFYKWLWAPHKQSGLGQERSQHPSNTKEATRPCAPSATSSAPSNPLHTPPHHGPVHGSSQTSSAGSSSWIPAAPAASSAHHTRHQHPPPLSAPFFTTPSASHPHSAPFQRHAPHAHQPLPPSSLTSPQHVRTAPRVTLLPFSAPRPDHPMSWRNNASLFLEVFNAFRKFGQTHHRLFFLLAERLQYDDLHCQSPARIAGLAEAAYELEALEISMLTLLRRVAWRRRQEFPFEHLNTVMWAISKVKASSMEAQGELDLMALHWSRGALHWLDGLSPMPAAQPSQRRSQPQRHERSASRQAQAPPNVAATKAADSDGDREQPGPTKKAAGQCEWEGHQLVRIIETVGSMAAVQYRPQGTSPQPKPLVRAVAVGMEAPRAGVSSISYPVTDAMTKEDEEIIFRGPFQRSIPMLATAADGLCLQELRLLYAHDKKRQETLDNMQKILYKARKHLYPRVDASRSRQLEEIFLLHPLNN